MFCGFADLKSHPNEGSASASEASLVWALGDGSPEQPHTTCGMTRLPVGGRADSLTAGLAPGTSILDYQIRFIVHPATILITTTRRKMAKNVPRALCAKCWRSSFHPHLPTRQI
jgi:hypothetical protein